ncbi:MAG: hypothetical protein HY654_13160 [Acidobacteria bacterium]|nr:hypothetical protein [Acidobacteriota bacterium]
MRVLLSVGVVLLLASGPGAQTPMTQPAPAAQDGVAQLLAKVEAALAAGNPADFLPLVASAADRSRAEAFAGAAFLPGATRAVVAERDRRALPASRSGDGYRLMVEVFVEAPASARVATWRLDVRRAPGQSTTEPERWEIAAQETLTSVDGLHRLSLKSDRQLRVRRLRITAEDFELRLPEGVAYHAETPEGVTALLLLGSGEMDFHPTPATERGQVRLVSGQDRLVTGFRVAFVRLNPIEVRDRLSAEALVPEPVNPRRFRTAEEIFREEVSKSYGIDLSDVSPHTWSLIPPIGDFLAEVRTKRYGTLTFARSRSEPEDVSLFNRAQRRNYAVYASTNTLAKRGRFYDEDDFSEYDVLDYQIAAAFDPGRSAMTGEARLFLKVRSPALSTFTLRLAETLNVESVTSGLLGRVLHLRVRNQNTLIVNLPATVTRDTVLDFTIRYAGPMKPQTMDREAILLQGQPGPLADVIVLPPEPSYIYSNRSYWYPQGSVTDYATASLQITVPASYECIASGELVGGPVLEPGPTRLADRKRYTFSATQPLRYLAVLVSRLVPVAAQTVAVDGAARAGAPAGRGYGLQASGFGKIAPESAFLKPEARSPQPIESETPKLRPQAEQAQGVFYQSVDFRLLTHPRLADRGREIASRAPDIIKFYGSLLGDIPYPGIALAVVENALPGGHSPAYLAAINQPSPFTPIVWRNDPAAFQNYPEFYVAHEIAHQWWGQAVGWKNYHEQWLSEGFAQYFAALYAHELRGAEVFGSVMTRFRRFAMNASDQGPVYLGYRLGHIKGDSRIFRSLVYNKGAAVLHMLRRLVGDEAFFRGLRRFYTTWRFRKAGTDDVRQAFEAETGRPLERFFERWIYGTSLPTLRFSYRRVSDAEMVVRFEQVGEVFDVPVTVRLTYADGRAEEAVVAVTDAVTEERLPLTGRVRRVDVHPEGALAEIKR